MSQVKIQGNPSGSGTFTIAAPNSNSDRTLNLPDGSGTINTSGAPNEVPAGSASAPAIYPTGDTNTGIFFPAADTIAFAEGGAEIAQFDSGGRFGLGITPSAWSASYKVQQTGFTNTYSLSNYQSGFVRGAFFNGSNWIAQNNFMGMCRYMMDENNHYWAIAPGVTSGTTVTWTTAMTVDSSGKLILGVAGQGIQFADGTTQTTAAVSGQLQFQLFTASGTTTWTAPAGVTRVKAVVVGAGGGGNATGGWTGGYGGFAIGEYTVVAGTGYSITVGAGGAGISSGTATTGGTTSFASFCSATGGTGGSNTNTGSGGVGSNGNIRNGSGNNNPAMHYFTGSGSNNTASAQAWSVSSTTSPGAPGGGGANAGLHGMVFLEWVG